MKRGTLALLLVTLLTLGLLLTACGTDSEAGLDTPTPAADSGGNTAATLAPGTTPAPTPPPTAQAGAKIGDAVPVKDYTISLDSAKIADGSLQASFTVDNTKGSGLVNLPDTAFNGYQTVGGTALDSDILCTTMPVKVEQGKKVTGLECWKVPGATATTGMRVQYASGGGAGVTVNWDLP